MSNELDAVFEGLAQAARVGRRRGIVSAKLAKQLCNLDIAFNLTKHATQSNSERFLDKLVADINSLKTTTGDDLQEYGRCGEGIGDFVDVGASPQSAPSSGEAAADEATAGRAGSPRRGGASEAAAQTDMSFLDGAMAAFVAVGGVQAATLGMAALAQERLRAHAAAGAAVARRDGR